MSKNYKHDCAKCTYLGEYEHEKDGRTYDLYSCFSSLIARYSDNPPDYISFPRVMADRIPDDCAVKEAHKRDHLRPQELKNNIGNR